MKLLSFIITVFMCFATNVLAVNIGDKLPAGATPLSSKLMTSPSEFREAYSMLIDNVEFTICPDESGRLVHISVSDIGFATPEGVHVGDAFVNIKSMASEELQVWRGWAFVLPLSSGWKAGFIQGESLTEGKLSPDAKVSFLFKGGPGG